jgi:ribokinase
MSAPAGQAEGPPQVVVVGSANIDYFYAVDRFAAPNETMHARSLAIDVGGKGLNQAVAAARAGAKVRFVGAIGTDPQASLVCQCLEANGIAATGLRQIAGGMTGSAAIMVAANGDNMITLAQGANGQLLPDDVAQHRSLIEQARVLLVQGEVSPETSKAALLIARAAGVMTICNPAPANAAIADLVALADLVTPNETEAMQITGLAVDSDSDVREAVGALLAMGATGVILTRGSRGYALGSGDEVSLHPAHAVTAIDTTGAGDVFNGVLAASLAAGMMLPDAARRASLAASLAVQRRGAMRSAPTAEEIDG